MNQVVSPKSSRQPLTESVRFRISTDDKRLAEAAAHQERRTLSNYLVMLIHRDADRRGLTAFSQGKNPDRGPAAPEHNQTA